MIEQKHTANRIKEDNSSYFEGPFLRMDEYMAKESRQLRDVCSVVFGIDAHTR